MRYLCDYPGVFDSEQIGLMSKAFDQAWGTVQTRNAGYTAGVEHEPARVALAKCIIAAAMAGELDPSQLSALALTDLAREQDA